MPRGLKIGALRNELTKKSKKQLIEDIVSLCKKYESVSDFYSISISSDIDDVLSKYKKVVREEFVPSKNVEFPKMRLSVARKAISEYRKLDPSKSSIADIMIWYVEAGVDCTNDYGDIDERFYASMESMYGNAIEYILKENLEGIFDIRLEKIVSNTAGIGWGFHDQLADLYSGYREQVLDIK
jgi:hypothetical protein